MPTKEILIILAGLMLCYGGCRCIRAYEVLRKVQIEEEYLKTHPFSPKESQSLPLIPGEIRDGLGEEKTSESWRK